MIRRAHGVARGLARASLVAGLLFSMAAWGDETPGVAASACTGQAPDWTRIAAARTRSGTLGMPALQHPAGSEPTPARIALGRKLFFDRRLSHNGTQSCGMCHVPEQGFTNNELSVAVGINGRSVRRNAPTVLNVGFYERLFVDGRESALETQFFSPLLSRDEMANPSVGHVVDTLRRLPDYAGQFECAFGAAVTPDRIGQALAAYQRSLIAGDSPFDRWRYGGRAEAIDATAQRGFALFTGKAGCANCHHVADTYALFTDHAFHDTGYGWQREQRRQYPPATVRVQIAPGVTHDVPLALVQAVAQPVPEDLGRYEVTLDPVDRWRYRTPQLRNVALTAPYMHDGGLSSLREVIGFYNAGGTPHEGISPLLRPLGLVEDEIDALVGFLDSLTSPAAAVLGDEARSLAPDNVRADAAASRP